LAEDGRPGRCNFSAHSSGISMVTCMKLRVPEKATRVKPCGAAPLCQRTPFNA
jgi:hypothetical protein